MRPVRTWLRLDKAEALSVHDPFCWVHLGGGRWLCFSVASVEVYVSFTLTPLSFGAAGAHWVEISPGSNEDQLPPG